MNGLLQPTTHDESGHRLSNAVERRIREGLDRARPIVTIPALLDTLEVIAREHALTAKQVELVAYATTQVDRMDLVTKLGVSNNTVKTRVRHLLRTLDEKSLDTLGKTVLRRTLERTATPLQ